MNKLNIMARSLFLITLFSFSMNAYPTYDSALNALDEFFAAGDTEGTHESKNLPPYNSLIGNDTKPFNLPGYASVIRVAWRLMEWLENSVNTTFKPIGQALANAQIRAIRTFNAYKQPPQNNVHNISTEPIIDDLD